MTDKKENLPPTLTVEQIISDISNSWPTSASTKSFPTRNDDFQTTNLFESLSGSKERVNKIRHDSQLFRNELEASFNYFNNLVRAEFLSDNHLLDLL